LRRSQAHPAARARERQPPAPPEAGGDHHRVPKKTARRPGDPAELSAGEQRGIAMKFAADLAPYVGTSAACAALLVPRATYYRQANAASAPPVVATSSPSPRGLSREERGEVMTALNCDEHADLSVRQVFARLLDRGIYHCAIRTMYRLLAQSARERAGLVSPATRTPSLTAGARTSRFHQCQRTHAVPARRAGHAILPPSLLR